MSPQVPAGHRSNTATPTRAPHPAGHRHGLRLLFGTMLAVAGLVFATLPALAETTAGSPVSCTSKVNKQNRTLRKDLWQVEMTCSRIDPGYRVQGVLDRYQEVDKYTPWTQTPNTTITSGWHEVISLTNDPKARAEHRTIKGAPVPDQYAVDVLNLSGSDVRVRFVHGPGDQQGRVTSKNLAGQYNYADELPMETPVTVAAGEGSIDYAYSIPGGKYDTGYWLEVTRGTDASDRRLAKVYRWSPGGSPPGVAEQGGGTLRIATQYLPRPDGFAGEKTRFVITDEPAQQQVAEPKPDWPHPGRWELDTVVGGSGGSGWSSLDDDTRRWRLDGLTPQADYWFRCYDTGLQAVAFQGRRPSAAELGGGVVDGRSTGFWRTSDDKGRITAVTGTSAPSGTCDVHSAPTEVDARRITGSTTTRGIAERPIYRVDITGATRLFPDGVSDRVGIPPYRVEAKDSAGAWRAVGTVLPSGQLERTDRTGGGDQVSYQRASFFFQDAVGASTTHLRVSGGYGTPSEIRLADLPAPSVSAGELSRFSVTATTTGASLELEANGVQSKALDVRLWDGASTEIRTGDLAKAYDSVYYRDEDGRLITGFYDPAGSTAITTGSDSRRVQLSTTDADTGPTSLTAWLSLDTHAGAEAQVSYTPYRTHPRLSGAITTGVSTTNGPAPAVIDRTSAMTVLPVYRAKAYGSGAVGSPMTVGLTRYQTLVSSQDLLARYNGAAPGANLQSDHVGAVPLDVQAGVLKGTSSDLARLEPFTSLTVTAVTGAGTLIEGGTVNRTPS